jgi:hypothetical protein
VPAPPVAAGAPSHAAHSANTKAHGEALDPAVAAELDAAESALSSGDANEALRLARHSLLAAKSGRAFALIARSYCRAGDLGNAKAALHSVRAADVARVKAECRRAGIEL